MKKFLIILTIFSCWGIWSTPSWATLGLQQSAVTKTIDNGDSAAFPPFGSPVTQGNTIVVVVTGWHTSGFGITSITDNQTGNTYNAAVSITNANGKTASHIYYAYNVNSNGGTFTVTVDPTNASGSYWNAVAYEITAGSSDPKDKTSSGTSAATTTPSAGPTTATTQNDEIVFGGCAIDAGPTSLTVESVSPAWTESLENINFVSSEGAEIDYKVITTTGTQSITWTSSPITTAEASVIATFKLTATAGGGGAASTIQAIIF